MRNQDVNLGTFVDIGLKYQTQWRGLQDFTATPVAFDLSIDEDSLTEMRNPNEIRWIQAGTADSSSIMHG
jgi:hypothetical protein